VGLGGEKRFFPKEWELKGLGVIFTRGKCLKGSGDIGLAAKGGAITLLATERLGSSQPPMGGFWGFWGGPL